MTQGKLEPEQPGLLMVGFLEAFMWLDRGLQENLTALGLPSVRRLESMVMIYTAVGVQRPSDFAKVLGVTRQSINSAIRDLEDKHLIELSPDPEDGRCKIVSFARAGEPVHKKAAEILGALETSLSERFGKKNMNALAQVLKEDWGPVPILVDQKKAKRRPRLTNAS
jgi:DNA-binding MarR family transcriptional regulator